MTLDGGSAATRSARSRWPVEVRAWVVVASACLLALAGCSGEQPRDTTRAEREQAVEAAAESVDLAFQGVVPVGCAVESQGGPGSCKEAGTWQQYAAKACDRAGLSLGEVQVREARAPGLWQAVD